jgi:protein SCO1
VRPSRSPINQIIGATILLLVAGGLFFPAYLFWNRSIQRSVTALPKCGDAPRFESSDQEGRSIGTTELSGTTWIAGFIDVAKPADAELLSSTLAELDQNLHGAKGVTLVLFCVGMDKNALSDYARRYEASDRWRFLSVDEDRSSMVFQDWIPATRSCRGQTPLQNVFVLIDRQGAVRGAYDALAPEAVQKILVDVGDLLRAEP